MKAVLIVLVSIMSLAHVYASEMPKIKSCISDYQKVALEITPSTEDSSMFDLKVMSTKNDRPAEQTFPIRENGTAEVVVYTLLDSEFEMLTVEVSTGQGKLANGPFFSPKPYIDVTCK